MLSIAQHFASLDDPRVERHKLYALPDLLAIALCAFICGAEGWEDIEEWGLSKLSWLREHLGLSLPHGIPSDDTFRRVFSRLEPTQLQACFLAWTQAIQTVTQGAVLALDGKTLRHSFDTATGKKAIHMVSAWACQEGLVLGQIKVEEKSNEITAIPALLELLEISGCIVTLDAMGCQRAIAAQIIEQQGEYVLALKGNHEHIHEDVRELFEHALEKNWEDRPHHAFVEHDKDHGRFETRRCLQIDLASLGEQWADAQQQWRGLASVVRIESERRIGEKVTRETRYYLSSLSGNARKVGRAIRKHWGIENRLHWVLDVSFDEDQCRIRKDSAPQNLAVLRHIVLNLLRREKSCPRGIRGKSHKAAWDEDYLLKVVTN